MSPFTVCEDAEAQIDETDISADAFWGPSYWSGWTPSSGGSNNLVLDTHQYYAFPPLNNLPQDQIIASICNVSGILKQNQASSAIPYTVVGEWSLETGMCAPSSLPQSRLHCLLHPRSSEERLLRSADC